ncbi:TlpA family protein disulfide reductase [Pustulibacterium marinum]|nr:TlpA disulfide reductase family protein [Pustulibacterium marinum]
MKKIIAILVFFTVANLSAQKTSFSDKALAEKMVTLDGKQISFENILNEYKGKTVVIDVWASWCSDCIKGMPNVKKLQEEYGNEDTVFLFLSLDRVEDSWHKGIEKYNVEGEHYFIQAGWKASKFCADIELDWIPRYMIVDKEGNIAYYKAIKANDEQFINHLKFLQ